LINAQTHQTVSELGVRTRV